MVKLDQIVGGLVYKSPIVVSSSPLTDNVDFIKQAEENGAGAVSTKLTLLYQPVKGIRQMYGKRGMFVFNPSDKRNDLEDGLRLVRRAKEETDLVIWSNIAGPGDDFDGWIKIARAFEQAGADALELNFICPNISLGADNLGQKVESSQKVGAVIGKDPFMVRQIVTRVKENVKIPVWVKPTTEAPDFTAIAKAIKDGGGDGITINAAPLVAPPIDIYRGGKPAMATLKNCSFGGSGGPHMLRLSLRYVGAVAKAVDIPIAGGGGLDNWKDIVEAMMYGSSLVTFCSKLIFDGFPAIKSMLSGLTRFMEENGYETIDQMRGLALSHIVQTSQLENEPSVAFISNEKCIGCGVCSRIGHCNAIILENKKAYVIPSKCVGCGFCQAQCSKNAISFIPKVK